MTHKIAIIKISKTFAYSHDVKLSLAAALSSVTEWTEVSDEDFERVRKMTSSSKYILLEQPPQQATIDAFIIQEKQAAEAAEAARKKKAEAALVLKKKKLADELDKKRLLIEKLQQEVEQQCDETLPKKRAVRVPSFPK